MIPIAIFNSYVTVNYQRVLCFGNNLAKFMAKHVFAQMTTQVCNQSSFFRLEDRRGVFGFQNIPRTHNHISYYIDIYIYTLCHIIMLHVQVHSSVAFCFFRICFHTQPPCRTGATRQHGTSFFATTSTNEWQGDLQHLAAMISDLQNKRPMVNIVFILVNDNY